MRLMTLLRLTAMVATSTSTPTAAVHAQDVKPPELRCAALARVAATAWPDSSTVIESAAPRLTHRCERADRASPL